MSGRLSSRVSAAAALVAALVVGTPAFASDPSSNTSPRGLYACDMNSAATYVSNDCLNGAVADFNAARAKEGLGHLLLPSNFRRLSIAQQLFVLTNIERVDRGLWPISGLSSRLDGVAARSASEGQDVLPCGNCYGGANWSSAASVLWSDFLWMYDDGPSSPNAAYPWGHRHNILVTSFPGPLLMGAATGTHGTGEVFEGGDTTDRSDVMTWAQESGYFTPIHQPSLHVNVSGNSIGLVLTGHSHTTVKVQRWNGSVWITVANYATNGTPAVAATWTKGVTTSGGTYRVVAMQNTRYARVFSGTIAVS